MTGAGAHMDLYAAAKQDPHIHKQPTATNMCCSVGLCPRVYGNDCPLAAQLSRPIQLYWLSESNMAPTTRPLLDIRDGRSFNVCRLGANCICSDIITLPDRSVILVAGPHFARTLAKVLESELSSHFVTTIVAKPVLHMRANGHRILKVVDSNYKYSYKFQLSASQASFKCQMDTFLAALTITSCPNFSSNEQDTAHGVMSASV